MEECSMELFMNILKYGVVIYLIVETLRKHKAAYRSSGAPKGSIKYHIILGALTIALTTLEVLVWGGLGYLIYTLVQLIP